VCPLGNDCFLRHTVSAVEAPKVAQISLSERLRTLYGDGATGYGLCFPFELCIPSYNGLSVCHVSGGFFVSHTVLPLQGFEVTYPIFEISMTHTVAKRFSSLSAKR